ncbi:MAG: ribonuclease Y [Candidatus Solincola sediminis]|uniref:Ribonuclease Y n=1 Tax=Candidatus Solincola sediminis TaxID=1797199 RepID=A0A1F2WGE8_9ACTN|nr:MAG: ribonuclease Y [Candidatus Solincola sediminis]
MLIAIIVGIAALAGGLIIGFLVRKFMAEAKISSAEEEAKRIVQNADQASEAKKHEALLEAKDEIFTMRNEAEKDIKNRRNELQRFERRLLQREEQIDNRSENFEKRERQLGSKESEIQALRGDVEKILNQEKERLERIAGLSREDAKQLLLVQVEEETKREAAQVIKKIESRLRDESEKRAKQIIANAIQRCASDHVAETTVSVVPLPNDEMKGRIIGREGRNIRTFETLTGINLIIDDTPEAVILSSFDPVRREVARLTLDRLITDGRIQPARIEEMYEKAKAEVDAEIKEVGEQAVFDVGLSGVHHELMRVLGRLKYRTSYGQNVLRHSLEVAYLAGMMAAELGTDIKLAKRAGLLHDIGKAIDHEVEGSHAVIGAELAKRLKESDAVIHAIEAHHEEVDAKSIEAVLVQAADAISAARPGARRETLESYIKRLEKLETIADSFEGVDSSYALQAGREIRVMVKSEVIDDIGCVTLSREIARQIEDELEYPGQIKITVVREKRTVEYAK